MRGGGRDMVSVSVGVTYHIIIIIIIIIIIVKELPKKFLEKYQMRDGLLSITSPLPSILSRL
jgi:hypothetical protein